MSRFGDFCFNATVLSPSIVRKPPLNAEEISWDKEVCRVRCAMRDASGREFFSDAAHMTENIVTFTLWRNPRISCDMAIQCMGGIYQIIQIDQENQRGPYMKIRAKLTKGEGA